MNDPEYFSLFLGYLAAMVGWFGLQFLFSTLWSARTELSFKKPWIEVLWAVVAVVGIIALGQLYQAEIRIPSVGPLAPILEALNHVIIFSPILILLKLRHQSLATAWINLDRLWLRLAVGLILALVAIVVYVKSSGTGEVMATIRSVYQYAHVSHAVQILMEDIAIAVLFVRIRAAIGLMASIFLVAVLFAAGHIPTMLSQGATLQSLTRLVLDASLGVMILSFVQRSRDISWFWFVHFAMDMMQFRPMN